MDASPLSHFCAAITHEYKFTHYDFSRNNLNRRSEECRLQIADSFLKLITHKSDGYSPDLDLTTKRPLFGVRDHIFVYRIALLDKRTGSAVMQFATKQNDYSLKWYSSLTVNSILITQYVYFHGIIIKLCLVRWNMLSLFALWRFSHRL